MRSQSLNGPWHFRQSGTPDWMPAVVPGNTGRDLLAAGRIADAARPDFPVEAAELDWEYQRVFTPDAGLLDEDQVELVCAGLDTLAELSLNGQPLGRTENMFRSYRWQVKVLLHAGENILKITFRSPLAYLAARQAQRALPGPGFPGMAYLRKTHDHFGGADRSPLPSCGIWRDITLEGHSVARLVDVHLRQEHAEGRVRLSTAVECRRWGSGDLQLDVTLTAPQGPVMRASAPLKGNWAALSLPVKNPQLWWPNGLGEQPLYLAEIELRRGEQVLDRRVMHLGLRSLELRQARDQWGRGFTFVVNGLPVFARGMNCHSVQVDPARLDFWLGSAAAAHVNMLRVRAGGYYEDDRFYDLCDRLGILVWQDFMFTDCTYPLDEPAFLENVHAEVVEQVRRLRQHACLALWCGNDGFELARPSHTGPSTQESQRFYYQQLSGWIQAEDPDHPYWPGSPSAGNFRKDANSDARGDVHFNRADLGRQAGPLNRSRLPRFASAFTLPSLPAVEDNPEAGPAQPPGGARWIRALSRRFRIPHAAPDLPYLMQIWQAETARLAVEHWRRHFPRCSGALLDACLNVPAAAGHECERWQALQYAARRFFAPLALSLEDTQDQIAIYVANDAAAPWRGELRWTLENLTGQPLEAGRGPVTAAPLSATRLQVLDLGPWLRGDGRLERVFTAELWQGETRLACQVATFAPEKDMRLPDPGLEFGVDLQTGELAITLTAHHLARFVELSLPGGEGARFSDNFFDLPAGRSARVTCPLPEGWTLEQARQALRVRSLVDAMAGVKPRADRLAPVRKGLARLSGARRNPFWRKSGPED